MHDAMRHAAQRHFDPVRKGRRLRQPLEPRRDPTAVLLREFLRLLHAAARRHGENHLARRRIDAQRVAPRLAMAAQTHEIDSPVENDLDNRGLARSTIKQCAKRHGRKSTLQQPPAKYCHSGKTARHDGQQIKSLPQGTGLDPTASYNSWGPLRFESAFIIFSASPSGRHQTATSLPSPAHR